MIITFLKLIAVALLLVTFWQDLRERAVYIFIFPLLFFSFISVSLINTSWPDLANNYLLNLVFLVLQVLLLYVYFSLRQGKATAILGSLVGWGDVLFWLVAGVLFSPANYIVFFLGSLVFSLLLHSIIYGWFSGGEQAKVPLAGYQALFLVILFIVQVFYPNLNFCNDYLLLAGWV